MAIRRSCLPHLLPALKLADVTEVRGLSLSQSIPEIMFGSSSKPNRIDTIEIPGLAGALGLVACPGVRIGDSHAMKRVGRNVRRDLQEILRWKASGVVTLMEDHELFQLKLQHLPDLVEKCGLWWRYLPIPDMYVPDARFEKAWELEGARMRGRLQAGERIVIHCFAGLGRTGMIAARILVELGMEPAAAIAQVREVDSRRIQTDHQLGFIHQCQSAIAEPHASHVNIVDNFG